MNVTSIILLFCGRRLNVSVMFVDADLNSEFGAITFMITALSLGVPLIICVIVIILQHLRFRRLKQQTGQLLDKLVLGLLSYNVKVKITLYITV